jgi:hypothetical protein
VNVRRFRAFIAVEEEAIGTNPQHRGRPRLLFTLCVNRSVHAITPTHIHRYASAECRPLGRCGQLRRDRGFCQRRRERRGQG